MSCTPGSRDSPHRIGTGSGTGPLDYESRDPVPEPKTLPIKYLFGQLSFYLKDSILRKRQKKNKKKNEKLGSLVVNAHTGLSRWIVGFDPRGRRGNILVPNVLSLVSFAGMTVTKWIKSCLLQCFGTF